MGGGVGDEVGRRDPYRGLGTDVGPLRPAQASQGSARSVPVSDDAGMDRDRMAHAMTTQDHDAAHRKARELLEVTYGSGEVSNLCRCYQDAHAQLIIAQANNASLRGQIASIRTSKPIDDNHDMLEQMDREIDGLKAKIAEAEKRAHAAIEGFEGYRNAARKLVAAVIAYDEAIENCGNSPDRMASFCTVEGVDLDALYERMRAVARTMQGRPTE